MTRRRHSPFRPMTQIACLVALLTSLGMGLAEAATKAATQAATSSAAVQYQRDRAKCARLRDHDERANCLSEASTANASRQPASTTDDSGRYEGNALMRCDRLPEPDAGDCRARIKGRGTTSGSVAGGGIYRELVTIEAPPVAAPVVTPSK